MLEFRAQATNIFNLVNYSSIDTSVTSPTFGRVTAAGAMRQFTIIVALSFLKKTLARKTLLKRIAMSADSNPIRR